MTNVANANAQVGAIDTDIENDSNKSGWAGAAAAAWGALKGSPWWGISIISAMAGALGLVLFMVFNLVNPEPEQVVAPATTEARVSWWRSPIHAVTTAACIRFGNAKPVPYRDGWLRRGQYVVKTPLVGQQELLVRQPGQTKFIALQGAERAAFAKWQGLTLK